jgi:hypothetical protein
MAKTKVQEEKQHHKEAYEIYFMMPSETRSIRAVARQLNKAPSTIQSWAESFNWKERVEIREAEISARFKEVQAKNDDTLVNMKASFHKILKALVADAIDRIKKQKLTIDSVPELIKVMELDMKLLGEDDRQQQNQLNEMTQALQASMQMFGMSDQQYTYDGNDRIEGDDDGDSSTEED